MHTALWITQALLAIAFLVAGGTKLMKSHEQMKADPHMGYANDYSGGFLKFIGTAEVLGALGLVLPGLLGIAPGLTPLAALGLAIIMAGAIWTHVRRGEMGMVAPTLALAALALFVAYGRYFVAPL
jgi:uncharacterized membrane protein YphA (DoxX/SURF4 family)